MKRSGKNTGFTLIELLVVVAIIALLVAILLPSLAKAKQVARRMVCASHHKAAGVALTMYANLNGGKLMHSWDRSKRTRDLYGNESFSQCAYTWWFYVLGEIPSGPAYKPGYGWWNPRTDDYGGWNYYSGVPETNGQSPVTPEQNPNYFCSEFRNFEDGIVNSMWN